YMFMQGHKLMEGVVTPLLLPVCSQLRHQREVEIQRLACHGTQRQNELSSYRHSQMPLDIALKQSTAFKDAPIYQRLKVDLERFVERLGKVKQPCEGGGATTK
ncbi:MAG: ABC transporter ATP-binding protein, partial [Bacteroidaceae bacterium]|nr:ABC transporter ATP-binding protein [Bacteroidaceae bacterium]